MNLFAYQVRDVARLLEQKRCILAEPVGHGKSIIICSVLRALWEQGCADKAVICAPKTIIGQWASTIRQWLSVEPICIGQESRLSRSHKYRSFMAGQNPVLIVPHRTCGMDAEVLFNLSFDVFVLDEAGIIRNHQSQIARTLKQHTGKLPYCYLVAANPGENDILELHSLMEMARPGLWPSYWKFRARYCCEEIRLIPVGRGRVQTVKKVVGVQRIEELRRDIATYCIRDGTYNGVDLPPLIIRERRVELSDSQRAAYDKVRKEPIPPWPRAYEARLWKLLRICSGLGSGEAGGAKVAELARLVGDELKGQQVLIYCAYIDTAKAVMGRVQALGISCSRMERSMSAVERRRIQEGFNAGMFDILVITPLGEYGLDLQACNLIVLVDRQFNPARNQNTIGRVNRIGQKSTVIVFNIVAMSTVDEVVLKILSRKITSLNEVFSVSLNSLGVDVARQIVIEDRADGQSRVTWGPSPESQPVRADSRPCEPVAKPDHPLLGQ